MVAADRFLMDRYLMPCQLGDPVGDLEKNGDCIGKEVTMVKCPW